MNEKIKWKKAFAGVILVFQLIPQIIFSQHVQLFWEPISHPGITQYRVYRSFGTDSSFELLASVFHSDTTYIDENLPRLGRYFYVATVLDSFGNESDFSNIVTVDIQSVPVEFDSFLAKINGNNITLQWLTASETNNYGFEIERRNGTKANFQKVDFIKGSGTTDSPKNYIYVDEELSNGSYYYRLKQIDYNGNYEYSEILPVSLKTPNSILLFPNSPNPFNSSTIIAYYLPQNSQVKLTIYSLSGQEVIKLVDNRQELGYYRVGWDGKNFQGIKVSSGIYYYKLRTENSLECKKMLLLK